MLPTMPAFPTTRWSLIAGSGDAPSARAAWSELAQAYRPPVLAYFRARFGPNAAEDLTQAFFAASIAGAWWSRADPRLGGFRTYLRTLLQRFGARHATGFEPAAAGEELELVETNPEPAAAYDRNFARTLVARAMAKVEADLDSTDRALWPQVLERGEHGSLQALSVELSVTPEALRQRLHRLRRRVAASMREEVAMLTADPEKVDEELRAIRADVRGG
jgi:DNA-directed RNA polymerase specialized sigma24 family protein